MEKADAEDSFGRPKKAMSGKESALCLLSTLVIRYHADGLWVSRRREGGREAAQEEQSGAPRLQDEGP